jgi:hypothetical protein
MHLTQANALKSYLLHFFLEQCSTNLFGIFIERTSVHGMNGKRIQYPKAFFYEYSHAI